MHLILSLFRHYMVMKAIGQIRASTPQGIDVIVAPDWTVEHTSVHPGGVETSLSTNGDMPYVDLESWQNPCIFNDALANFDSQGAPFGGSAHTSSSTRENTYFDPESIEPEDIEVIYTSNGLLTPLWEPSLDELLPLHNDTAGSTGVAVGQESTGLPVTFQSEATSVAVNSSWSLLPSRGAFNDSVLPHEDSLRCSSTGNHCTSQVDTMYLGSSSVDQQTPLSLLGTPSSRRQMKTRLSQRDSPAQHKVQKKQDAESSRSKAPQSPDVGPVRIRGLQRSTQFPRKGTLMERERNPRPPLLPRTEIPPVSLYNEHQGLNLEFFIDIYRSSATLRCLVLGVAQTSFFQALRPTHKGVPVPTKAYVDALSYCIEFSKMKMVDGTAKCFTLWDCLNSLFIWEPGQDRTVTIGREPLATYFSLAVSKSTWSNQDISELIARARSLLDTGSSRPGSPEAALEIQIKSENARMYFATEGSKWVFNDTVVHLTAFFKSEDIRHVISSQIGRCLNDQNAVRMFETYLDVFTSDEYIRLFIGMINKVICLGSSNDVHARHVRRLQGIFTGINEVIHEAMNSKVQKNSRGVVGNNPIEYTLTRCSSRLLNRTEMWIEKLQVEFNCLIAMWLNELDNCTSGNDFHIRYTITNGILGISKVMRIMLSLLMAIGKYSYPAVYLGEYISIAFESLVFDAFNPARVEMFFGEALKTVCKRQNTI